MRKLKCETGARLLSKEVSQAIHRTSKSFIDEQHSYLIQMQEKNEFIRLFHLLEMPIRYFPIPRYPFLYHSFQFHRKAHDQSQMHIPRASASVPERWDHILCALALFLAHQPCFQDKKIN